MSDAADHSTARYASTSCLEVTIGYTRWSPVKDPNGTLPEPVHCEQVLIVPANPYAGDLEVVVEAAYEAAIGPRWDAYTPWVKQVRLMERSVVLLRKTPQSDLVDSWDRSKEGGQS